MESVSNSPYITIQKMTYLEYFIQNEKSWAIVPASVAVSLKTDFHFIQAS